MSPKITSWTLSDEAIVKHRCQTLLEWILRMATRWLLYVPFLLQCHSSLFICHCASSTRRDQFPAGSPCPFPGTRGQEAPWPRTAQDQSWHPPPSFPKKWKTSASVANPFLHNIFVASNLNPNSTLGIMRWGEKLERTHARKVSEKNIPESTNLGPVPLNLWLYIESETNIVGSFICEQMWTTSEKHTRH